MKLNKIFYSLIFLVILGSGIISCKKSTFDINKDPNQPTDSTVTYNLILPAAMQTTSAIVANSWGWLQNWLGFWARSGTYAPNVTEETYTITTNFQNGLWNNLYSNALNYEIMRQKANVAGATFYEGVGTIMKAHNFQILVDIYNNVPYFDALKGNANPTPKYDKGLDIYKDLFRQIDKGIELINATVDAKNVDYKTNDLLFGGDKTKWNKFGNTLKLRMLVHLSGVAGFDFASEMAIIQANGKGFLGAGETAQLNPGFNSTKPNPFYRTYVRDEGNVVTGNSVYYKANSYAIGYYNLDGDPRLARFYVAGSQGQRGVPYGLPPVTENAAGTLSGVNGPGVLKGSGYDSPAWILTAMESLFLQAEARQRGILNFGPTAKTLYTNAVVESFTFMGLTANQANTYFAFNAGFPDVDFDVDPIYAIISQKWFALNAFAPFEVWADYRRVDHGGEKHFVYGVEAGYDPGPPISVAPQNTATEIPVRLLYPQNEYNYNSANVGAEGTINQFTSKVFWDVN